VLAAGALALAVSAPALESVHITAEPERTAVAAAPAAVVTAALELRARERVASRAAARRSATRPAATAVSAARQQIVTVRRELAERRELARQAAARREALARRQLARQVAARREALAQRHFARRVAARPEALAPRGELAQRRAPVGRARTAPRAVGQRAKHRTRRAAPAGMASVIAFAQSQVGKRYSAGGEGPHAFDCSGFTKRAYALAGIRLPHSSGAQAARARTIPRSAARPGDLVVGPGHVGIYMGRGMMIDAGNRRTGVVYRKMYAGLHIERF
jgi:peptidoglycan DL-endopeptidase CwlO